MIIKHGDRHIPGEGDAAEEPVVEEEDGVPTHLLRHRQLRLGDLAAPLLVHDRGVARSGPGAPSGGRGDMDVRAEVEEHLCRQVL